MATKVHAQYVSDNGTTYQIQTLDYLQAAGSLAAATNQPGKPVGMHPRHLNVVSASGERRKLVVNPSNSLWTAARGSSVNINGVAFVVTGHSGERRIGI